MTDTRNVALALLGATVLVSGCSSDSPRRVTIQQGDALATCQTFLSLDTKSRMALLGHALFVVRKTSIAFNGNPNPTYVPDVPGTSATVDARLFDRVLNDAETYCRTPGKEKIDLVSVVHRPYLDDPAVFK